MPPPRIFRALGVFVREAFLSDSFTTQVTDAIGRGAGSPAEEFARNDAAAVDPALRRAWEVPLSDDLSRALDAAVDALRPDLEAAFGVALGTHEGVSALRYPAGAFYRPHRDRRAEPSAFDAHKRAVSVVMFINGATPQGPAPFRGGCLRLYECLPEASARDVGLDLAPEAGTLVAFRSDQLHEVTPVTEGERYTLVTWFHER